MIGLKMTDGPQLDLDPRFTAALDMLGRTGAEEFQMRWCEEEEPTIWMAMARWKGTWEVAAAMGPNQALFRLCDQVIDGGKCMYCHRPTGFAVELGDMPLPRDICWYQFDPELVTFRRGCE